ncbi:hypothetical protein QFC20_003020 [Naganishia adeliensis]|uniref:Uncharacterized protein n=1 Tax=Naganishia adeliensis TaxID=92952 RepID=A0ACC2WEJ7_9TREE|nr:hypothetical protein QFC20_003020 [Naganishia adeliensis]
MGKTKSKSTGKGGGGKYSPIDAIVTSAVTTVKRKAVATSAKTAAKRSRRVQEESDEEDDDDDERENREEIESEEEVEDSDGGIGEESQEVPEQVESNFLETQQKDEMAELKARLQDTDVSATSAKRLQKLKKTMNSRVSQFDEVYEAGMEEMKKIERSAAGKELKKQKQSLKAFLESCLTVDVDDSTANLEQAFKSLKSVARETGSTCSKFADRDLAATAEMLAASRETIAARPKRVAHSAREIGHQVTEELNGMAERTQEQLDARAFLKDHFKTMAKYGANA